MVEALFFSGYFIAVFALAIVVVGGLLTTHAVSRRLSDASMWTCLALLLVFGASFLDFLTAAGVNQRSLGTAAETGHIWGPAIWLKRLAVVTIVTVTLVRTVRGFVRSEIKFDLFFASLLLYWITNYALNAVGGTDLAFVPTALYAIPIMLCVYASDARASEGFERGMRIIVFIVLVASLVSAPVAPFYTITKGNTTILGFLGGRLNGVTGHPNTLAQIALMGLIVVAFGTPAARKGWLTWPLILLGLLDLVLSQSKTAIVTVGIIASMKVLEISVGRFDTIRRREGTMAIALGVMFIAALAMTLQMFDVFAHLIAKLQQKIPQLSTLTGRTEIWRLTYDEFRRNPLFGFGPGLWDINFRMNTGLMEVGHAHNQFMQTLGSSGLFGVAGLMFYVWMLVRESWLALRRFNNWLPMASFLILLVVSIAEAPLRLTHPMDVGVVLQLMVWLSLHSMRKRAEAEAEVAAVEPQRLATPRMPARGLSPQA